MDNKIHEVLVTMELFEDLRAKQGTWKWSASLGIISCTAVWDVFAAWPFFASSKKEYNIITIF